MSSTHKRHLVHRQALPNVDSIEELLRCFEAGQVASLDAELVLADSARRWRMDFLREHFAAKKVFRFDRVATGTRKPPCSSLIELCESLSALGDQPPKLDGNLFRFPHGVINSRRLCRSALVHPRFAKCFGATVSFVWIGVSAGTFHRDVFNNVLVQVQGRKRVTVFPPDVSRSIAQKHHIELRRVEDVFAEPNLERFPQLAECPWFQVELNEGDALVIPSGAFHSVVALTPDAVSINCFGTPAAFGKHYLGQHARKLGWLPWWMMNVGIQLSRLTYSMLGKPMIRTGAYELM